MRHEQMLQDFIADRPEMGKNNNEDSLSTLLASEYREFIQSWHNYKSGKESPKQAVAELVDVYIFIRQLIESLGYDFESEVKEKIAANIVRYSASLFSGGIDYQEAVSVAKKYDEDRGIREQFYDDF